MAADTLEALDLEQLITEVAPCDWGPGHAAFMVPCSEAVTHLAWPSCDPSVPRIRICLFGAAFLLRLRDHECRVGHPCVLCGRPIRECWKVVPI